MQQHRNRRRLLADHGSRAPQIAQPAKSAIGLLDDDIAHAGEAQFRLGQAMAADHNEVVIRGQTTDPIGKIEEAGLPLGEEGHDDAHFFLAHSQYLSVLILYKT